MREMTAREMAYRYFALYLKIVGGERRAAWMKRRK